MRGLLRRLEERAVLIERFRGAHRLADVAKARDAADDAPVHLMRRDVALENPAVLEVEDVEMLRSRIAREELLRRAHGMRVVAVVAKRVQPVEDEIEAAAREVVGGEAEHFEAAAVAADHVAVQIDHENRVMGRVERRFEEGDSFFERRAIGHVCVSRQSMSSAANYCWPMGCPVWSTSWLAPLSSELCVGGAGPMHPPGADQPQ